MFDPRNKKLAKILVEYSVKVKKDDKVFIDCNDPLGLPLAHEVWKQALLKGAYPYLDIRTEDLVYFYFKNASSKQLESFPNISNYFADWADKTIRIRAIKNERALSNIPSEKLLLREKIMMPIWDKFLQKPWVVTYYPTASQAQLASMSLEELENFYYQACLQDWSKINSRLKKLKRIMDNALKVTVLGEKTNLSFSLKGRFSQVCAGQFNMPDGEVFCAPLDGTMDGKIYFNYPTLRSGKEVKDIYLKFKNGQVVDFSASSNHDYLAKTLKIDKGANKPGEFAIGTNYAIKRFMLNTLFDEKMGGTIHLALGKAYKEKEGGGKNESCIHWDLVKDMRKRGSKVMIDGKTVLKDGKIV